MARIGELILEGKILAEISNGIEMKNKYDIWCSKLRAYMEGNGFSG